MGSKRAGLTVFCGLVMIVMTSGVLAISSDLKANYGLGETVTAKISGNILAPILPTDVEFKKANVRVPFEYDIKKLGENYYIWFNTQLDAEQTNYTLIVHGISTTVSGKVEKIDFVQNFSISGNASDYYIRPGFVFTKEDFSVSIVLNKDENQDININGPQSQTLTLKPGQNSVTFHMADFQYTGLQSIGIGKYNFLAYIIKNGSIFVNRNNSLDLSPEEISSIRLKSDKDAYYQIKVTNIGLNDVADVYLDYNKDIFSVVPTGKIILLPGEYLRYNVTVKNSDANISEIVYVKSDLNNVSYSLPINIVFLDNISQITPINNITENQTDMYTCLEQLGTICSINEKCNGNIVVSLDGACCKGTCQANNGGGTSYSWLGYLIGIIVIAAMAYIYFKYKKVNADKNPLEKNS